MSGNVVSEKADPLVPVETVKEMLNKVIPEVGKNDEEEGLASRNLSQAADLQVGHPVPLSEKLSFSPFSAGVEFCPQTLHERAEECKSLVQMRCQHVEALKNEMQEMKLKSCNGSVSSRWWPAESCRTDTVSNGYRRAQHLPAAPLAVATTAPSADRSQSPACNVQCLRRTPATDITPAKASLCGKNGLALQQHINAFEKINPFNFQEPSKPPFFLTSNSDLAYRSHETEAGSTHGKSEDDDGPHFDLVVPLPDKVEESQETAEEDKAEFMPYSQRVKLFRFDPDRSQWKQRGAGSLKILENGVNVKVVVMQREQVLKVCANHWRTTTVNLKVLSGSGKAWMWMSCEFSDGNAKLGQLAAKFRTAEQAEEFKQKFEECQQLLLDVPVRTPPKLVDTGRTAQLTEKAEETKRGLRDLRTSVTDARTKLAKEETTNSVRASGPSDSVIKPHAEDEVCEPTAQKLRNTFSFSDRHTSGISFSESVGQNAEEAEKVPYSQRVKLFRFDPDRSQWKQRGAGSLKILENGVNVKVVVMQREQVLKVCANHWRTTTVNLKVLSGSGKAWMWMSCEFSDGNAKLGQLAAKFRTAEQAEEFKQKFEECQQLLLDVPVRTPPKLVDTGRTAQLTEKAEETKHGLRDLRTSVTDARTKLAKEETTNSVCASGPSDSVIKPHAEGTAPALERSKCGLRGEASSSSCVFTVALASSPVRISLSPIGESAADSLQSASSPSSSPAKQNQSGASLKTLGQICVSSTSDGPTKTVDSPPKFVFRSESVRRIFNTGKSETFTFGNSSGTGSLFGFSFKPPGKSRDSIVTFQKAEQKEMGVAELPKSSVSPRKPSGSMASNSAPSAQDGPSNFSFKILEKDEVCEPTAQKLRNTFSFSDRHTSGISFSESVGQNAEEAEKVPYSQRVKLFRFDPDRSQWKQRGAGSLKILENGVNVKVVVMQREQVLKVCANHWRTTTVNLKVLSGSGKAWMWMACEFSDGNAKLGQLAAKFRTAEQAEEFKQKFEECQQLLLDVPVRTPPKLVDTGRTAQLSEKAEETKRGLRDLRTSVTDARTRLAKEETTNSVCASGPSDSVIKPHAEGTAPALERSKCGLRGEASSSSCVYALPLASSPVRISLSPIGESAADSLQSASSPSSSPAKQNQSGAAVGTDENSRFFSDRHTSGISFSESVGQNAEEAEKVPYSQRVKLFRFDPDRSQWKQRGAGSLKILENGVNVKVVVMQREQVLKVCANHWRTTTVNLKVLSGSGKAWMWMACEFSDGNAKLGQLAAKFRTAEQAEEFKQKFEECQQLLLDVPVRTPPKLVDTGRTAQLTEKAEETKRGLRDLRTSVTDARTKLAKEETTNSVCASGPSDSVIKPHAEGTAPALERSKCGLRGEASSSSCVYALPLASSPVRISLSPIGESAADSLQSASSPSSSPAKQNQSGASLKALGPICVSSTSDRPTKTVDSPPKFVFRSESVRRIFNTGKSETFTFGNSSGTGSLFGFSFKPPGKSGDSIVTFQKAEQKEMGVAELPKSSVSPRKPSGSMASNSAPSAQDGPSNFSFKILEKGEC
ncbi:E3 SUMO-protein ligase RanBP2-like [Cyrtonyx montezumae]|uniref:E3 SUMO-protein ligase RanBP2-like n=1 Tax=Cyrtonyx montezumae TaxID=9017 RepID=UPI0032DB17E7